MMNSSFARYESYKDSGTAWLGQIPRHWEVRRVKDELANLDYKRIPLSGEVRERMENPQFDYYGASGIIDKVDDYIFDEPLILLGEDGANLLARSSPLAFIARGKYWVNNHAHILRPYTGELSFFCYQLESFDYTILVSGSAQPKLTAGQLNNILLRVPPLLEQKVIADYLDTKTAQIDRKIDLLTQKADKYRELRQTLINETVTRGLDKSAVTKDSEIDWIEQIPAHWEVKRVKEIGKIVLGKMLDNSPGEDKFYRSYLKSKNIGWLTVDMSSVEQMYFTQAEMKSYRLKKGDLLLSEGGEVGKTSYWEEELDECYIQNSVQKVTVSQENHPRYFLYQSFMLGGIKYYDSIVNQVSIKHLTKEKLSRVLWLCPPFPEQKAIANYLDEKTTHIDQIISTLNNQIEKLQELRKTLINEVVTGQIKVI